MEHKQRLQLFAMLKTLPLGEVSDLGLRLETERKQLVKEKKDVLRQRYLEEQLEEISLAVAYLQHTKISPSDVAEDLLDIRGKLYRYEEWCQAMFAECRQRAKQAKAEGRDHRDDRANHRNWGTRGRFIQNFISQVKTMENELKMSEDMELSNDE